MSFHAFPVVDGQARSDTAGQIGDGYSHHVILIGRGSLFASKHATGAFLDQVGNLHLVVLRRGAQIT
jgi:hypothetical protein